MLKVTPYCHDHRIPLQNHIRSAEVRAENEKAQREAAEAKVVELEAELRSERNVREVSIDATSAENEILQTPVRSVQTLEDELNNALRRDGELFSASTIGRLNAQRHARNSLVRLVAFGPRCTAIHRLFIADCKRSDF